MREKNIVLITCAFLVGLSFLAEYYSFYESDFNFYESELVINGSHIQESLHYSPDNEYHTLFRNFVDNSYLYPEFGSNSVSISNVSCTDGRPYFFSSNYDFYSFDYGSATLDSPLENTEGNEYGCSFGDVYGFFKGENYSIYASYYLNAENIFNIDGKNYIKFVAYSPRQHPTLRFGKNFFVSENVIYNDIYFPRDSVVIYIPYEENTFDKNIIYLDDFDFDNSYLWFYLDILLGFLPAFIFYLVWYFFGKESADIEVPASLSSAPSKRKAWEVAVYFQPPFNAMGRNFISSLILELSNRKIVDIKVEKAFFGNECYIKVLNKNAKMDFAEEEFLEILAFAKSHYSGKYSSEGYVNLAKVPLIQRQKVGSKFVSLQRSIEKKNKEFFQSKGNWIFSLFNVGLMVIFYLISEFSLMILSFISLFIGLFIMGSSSVFIRYNKNYYKEYLGWTAFKNYLNSAPSLKLHGHKGVIVWGEYLTYAAALGVSTRVIKELQNKGIITQEQYSVYTNVGYFSSSAMTSGATGASHGGAGGGGVGGGGGGGR